MSGSTQPLDSFDQMKAKKIWMVVCIDDDTGDENRHAFSSLERLEAWCSGDDRRHIIYDYVLDHPERNEQPGWCGP